MLASKLIHLGPGYQGELCYPGTHYPYQESPGSKAEVLPIPGGLNAHTPPAQLLLVE